MASEPFTTVGRIVKTHGLKGEVSVVTDYGASLDLLVGLPAWLVPPVPSLRQTAITGVRPGPKGPIASLAGVDSIDVARQLQNRTILVETNSLPEDFDAQEEFDDVVGYELIDAKRGSVGTITEVLITGANDVWIVHGPFGEVLVPVIDDVVVEIDDETQTIDVELLDGLIEGEE
ncbi:MAG TPA: ribosome maturation factor RimM [Coriobacteriia bacterium]|nr:ribosome maturation factor RimM [Coriobacteriia bacterium]